MGQEAVQLYAHAGQGGTGLSLQFADTCCWGPAVTLPVLASNWPPRTPPSHALQQVQATTVHASSL
jgi:hypothetical protein